MQKLVAKAAMVISAGNNKNLDRKGFNSVGDVLEYVEYTVFLHLLASQALACV